MVEKPAEQVLTGGNVAGRVVRVGPTARKPVTQATAAVEALLRHLAERGFEGSPRSLGRDGAGPGSRLWDLAYAAHGFVPFAAGGDPARDGPRLRALADGYGPDDQQRRDLPALIGAHTRAMYGLLRSAGSTGAQPWARLYAEGHARHWGPAADYIDRHHGQWLAALLS